METAGGAAQNRMDVGRSNRYLIKVQFNFAIGMVITRPQHAMQAMSSRGVMIVTRNSQKQAIPNRSAAWLASLVVRIDEFDETEVVAPYDLKGTWMGRIKDTVSLGLQDTVCE